MAMKINQETCIQCGACLPECPNEGISETAGDYRIDSQFCTECYGFNDTPTCASVCPTDAIMPDPDCPCSEEGNAEMATYLRPDHFPRD